MIYYLIQKQIIKKKKIKNECKINDHFTDNQFHNDYRDVMTALNNINPTKKEKFNEENLEVEYSEPNEEEIQPIIEEFINLLNCNIINEVPDFRNQNSGWDELIPTNKLKSEWDLSQEALGILPSLYNDPAKRNKVKLICIQKIQKFDTCNETKYSNICIIQKLNVEDQMIIKINLIIIKKKSKKYNNLTEMPTIIEDVFIIGYLSNLEYNDEMNNLAQESNKNFYSFDNLNQNNLVDDDKVKNFLIKEYQKINENEQNRINCLDDEMKEYYRTLPKKYINF